MINALPRLGAALIRHLDAYCELLGDEARLAAGIVTRRLVGLMLAVRAAPPVELLFLAPAPSDGADAGLS